jgi:septation ring formation regulator EzrA
MSKLLQLNIESEKQTLKLREQLERIDKVRQFERAELDSANAEISTMNREMSDIYDILRQDMGKILKYLAGV